MEAVPHNGPCTKHGTGVSVRYGSGIPIRYATAPYYCLYCIGTVRITSWVDRAVRHRMEYDFYFQIISRIDGSCLLGQSIRVAISAQNDALHLGVSANRRYAEMYMVLVSRRCLLQQKDLRDHRGQHRNEPQDYINQLEVQQRALSAGRLLLEV